MELFKSLENKTKSFNDPFKHFEINQPLTNNAIQEISKAEVVDPKRIFSGHIAPVIHAGNNKKIISAMKYSVDPLPEYVSKKRLTTYNVRSDNLDSRFWSHAYKYRIC